MKHFSCRNKSRPVKDSNMKEKNLLRKSDQYIVESTKLWWKSLKTAYILYRQIWFVMTDLTIIFLFNCCLFNCWLDSYKLLSCPKQKLFKWTTLSKAKQRCSRKSEDTQWALEKDENNGDWKGTQSTKGSEQGNCQRLADLLPCFLTPFLLYPLPICLPKVTKGVLKSSLICLQRYYPKRIPVVLSFFPLELNNKRNIY